MVESNEEYDLYEIKGSNDLNEGNVKNNSKRNTYIYISIGVFIALIFAEPIVKALGGNPEVGETLPFLLIVVFVHYTISFVWPEFFLLAYCKFRFQSFNYERPLPDPTILKAKKREEANKSREAKRVEAGKGVFRYWFRRPLAVLLSRQVGN